MAENSIQSLDRALNIIELLAVHREGMGVTEIGKLLELHKSTVHRILNALLERGYIEKEEKHGYYKLGLKFIEISSLYLNKVELKTEALPYLRRLAEITGQSVHLAILQGMEAIYIEKVEAVNSIRMYSQIGRRVPVYCSAIGKVLLSGKDDEELDKILNQICFNKITEHTLTSKVELLKEIHQTKMKGFAIDNEENEIGIRCIASPIFDYRGKLIASVSTSGDKKFISEEKDMEVSSYVKEAADNISRRLGYIG